MEVSQPQKGGDLHRLEQVACYLLDMDGTVYLGDRLVDGALEFLHYLEQRRIPFYFLTNNSSRSKHDYAARFARLGLPGSDRIFTSGEVTALYLQKRHPGAKLFVAGTPSLQQEFQDHGFTLVDEQPDLVVLGFDTTLTYEKVRKLCDFVRAGLPYLATHPDINCPTETGVIPDIGAIMALVAASTGRRPDLIAGKPHPPLVEAVVAKTGLPLEALAMVGDRLYTDIALGATGLTTILVLSGETRLEELETSPYRPDFIMQDLAALHQALLALE